MSLLGIDIGTTGCKSAAFSVDGKCLASAYQEYPTLHPQEGWAELDSRQVYDKVKQTIAEVAHQTSKDPITALCISSMGEALTPVSSDHEILDNCILHVDLRGMEYVDRLKGEIGQEDFYAINPNILGPNYSLPKLLWLRDHQPYEFKQAWKYLPWSDLVSYLLGGEPLTSYSHANRTLLFDIHREDWSDRLLDWAGLDRNLLPATVASGTIAGKVNPAIAAELGLPGNVTIVVGSHDQCCNSLGAGIYKPGKASCGIGTVECIAPAYSRIPSSQEMLPLGLNIEHQVLPNIYLSFIYNQSGVLVRWFRDVFAAKDKELIPPGKDIYDLLSTEVPEEPTHLLVLPHFEPTGTPDMITNSAGVIAGLHTSTTRGEILKAIFESTTFYFLQSIQSLQSLGIDTSEFVATGGGARSSIWLQIKSDIFGVPFIRPRFTECGILGAAILAGLSTGVFSSPQQAVSQFIQVDRVFEPDMKRHQQYLDLYENYQKLYPSLKEILSNL